MHVRALGLLARTLSFSTVLTLSACSHGPYVWVHDLPAAPASAAGGRITRGDVVSVRVYGEDALTTRGRVRQDGTLTIPLIGPVPVEGQMPSEVAPVLAERFKPFVLDPRVIVIIEESLVTVTSVGEVKTPGLIELERPATVLQALAKVGGLTDFADRANIYVLRSKGSATERIRFTYDELVEGRLAAAQFQLATGDVLVVE